MEIVHSLPMLGVVRADFWRGVAERLATARCRLMHGSISLPVKGKYVCWTCLREFSVKW